jgi:hypothetical protein
MAQGAAWRRAAWEAAVPDAWSAGESHGGPPWLSGGNLMIFPFHGGSPIYFGTKPVGGTLPLPFNLPGGGGFGIEGTIGPNGQEAGAGFAGVVPTPLGDALFFASLRHIARPVFPAQAGTR